MYGKRKEGRKLIRRNDMILSHDFHQLFTFRKKRETLASSVSKAQSYQAIRHIHDWDPVLTLLRNMMLSNRL